MEASTLLSEHQQLRPWCNRVEQAFSRAARSYDGAAQVQRETAKELATRILREPHDHLEKILDVGTGTGELALLLAALLPGSRIAGCDISKAMIEGAMRKARGRSLANIGFHSGPAERLPYPSETFSLTASSLALHWADDPQHWIKEQARVLRPRGRLQFATSAPDTLPELRASLQTVLGEDCRTCGFPPPEHLAELLESEGFSDVSLETRTFVEHHHSARSLFASMRARGVRLPPPDHRPLSISQIRNLLAFYDAHFVQAGGVRASYRVIFGKGVLRG